MTTTDLALNIPSSSPLARLETARRLLAEVRGVDDAKAIHDFAEAARIYARQARLGLEAQNDAAEITSSCALNASWAKCWLLCQNRMAAMPLELGRRLRPRSHCVWVISASRRPSRPAGRRSPPCPSTSSIGTSPTCANRVAATARPS